MYQRNIAIKSRPKATILRIKKQKKKRLKAQITTTSDNVNLEFIKNLVHNYSSIELSEQEKIASSRVQTVAHCA